MHYHEIEQDDQSVQYTIKGDFSIFFPFSWITHKYELGAHGPKTGIKHRKVYRTGAMDCFPKDSVPHLRSLYCISLTVD